MKYEILENNKVVNTIEANDEFVKVAFPNGNYRIVNEVSVESPLTRKISVGSFFDRFGEHKWGILSDANPLVQALIKDCSVRKYIDLDDPQLLNGLLLLNQAGHMVDVPTIVEKELTRQEHV